MSRARMQPYFCMGRCIVGQLSQPTKYPTRIVHTAAMCRLIRCRHSNMPICDMRSVCRFLHLLYGCKCYTVGIWDAKVDQIEQRLTNRILGCRMRQWLSLVKQLINYIGRNQICLFWRFISRRRMIKLSSILTNLLKTRFFTRWQL